VPQAEFGSRYVGQETETLPCEHKPLSPAKSLAIAHRRVAAQNRAIGWPREGVKRPVETGCGFLFRRESWPAYREQRGVDGLLCSRRAGQKNGKRKDKNFRFAPSAHLNAYRRCVREP
jgi:hypothetical protein